MCCGQLEEPGAKQALPGWVWVRDARTEKRKGNDTIQGICSSNTSTDVSPTGTQITLSHTHTKLICEHHTKLKKSELA